MFNKGSVGSDFMHLFVSVSPYIPSPPMFVFLLRAHLIRSVTFRKLRNPTDFLRETSCPMGWDLVNCLLHQYLPPTRLQKCSNYNAPTFRDSNPFGGWIGVFFSTMYGEMHTGCEEVLVESYFCHYFRHGESPTIFRLSPTHKSILFTSLGTSWM